MELQLGLRLEYPQAPKGGPHGPRGACKGPAHKGPADKGPDLQGPEGSQEARGASFTALRCCWRALWVSTYMGAYA